MEGTTREYEKKQVKKLIDKVKYIVSKRKSQ